MGSISGLGRSPGEGNDWQPTPVFLLGNSMDRGAWQATVHRVTKSWTQLKWLSTHACILKNVLNVTMFFHWKYEKIRIYMYVVGKDEGLRISRQQNCFPNHLLTLIKSSVTQHAPSREIRRQSFTCALKVSLLAHCILKKIHIKLTYKHLHFLPKIFSR